MGAISTPLPLSARSAARRTCTKCPKRANGEKVAAGEKKLVGNASLVVAEFEFALREILMSTVGKGNQRLI